MGHQTFDQIASFAVGRAKVLEADVLLADGSLVRIMRCQGLRELIGKHPSQMAPPLVIA